MHQTHPSQAPAPDRRPVSHRIDFLRHAASIGRFDVASFVIALHELMARRGKLVGVPRARRRRLPEPALWATIDAGLEWLETLHQHAPEDGAAARLMQNRIEDLDDEALLADLKRARDRAKWCGGMPVWLVVANVAVLALGAVAAVSMLVREPVVVEASGPVDYATPAELRALEQRIDTLQDDQAFVLERLARRLERAEAPTPQAND